MKNFLADKKWLILGLICIVTFICFSRTLQNEFTNWDDDAYVTKDEYIKSFTPEHLKAIFTEDITKNNYHPFCMISLAVNYYFSQLNPESYYLTNIIIHIFNVILVFILFIGLCTKLKVLDNGKLFIAGLGALLFGIHPMHVESVSWIAERKDVLYCFFYVAGLISYLKYINTLDKKWYWITFALFISSCLSKPMGVVFPLSLVCMDFLTQRKLDRKLINEKVVFFVFAFLLGVLAFYTQNKAGTIASFSKLTLPERLMYATYGYVMYLAKFIYPDPANLSTFYPYPYRYISGYLPGIYYAAPFLAIGIPAICIWLVHKFYQPLYRVVGFGFAFFTANVIFVLQFISVGAAIMADRYSYVSYIGIVFMVPFVINELIKRFPKAKIATAVILALLMIRVAGYCYERTAAWHNAETLTSDAIEKFPYRALLSYKWRGNYYRDAGEYDKAIKDYNTLTMLRAADVYIYESLYRIYTAKNDYSNAYAAYQIADAMHKDKNFVPGPMPGQDVSMINTKTGEAQYSNDGNDNGGNSGLGQVGAPQPANNDAGNGPQPLPANSAHAPVAGNNAPKQGDIPESVRQNMAASAKQKLDPQVVNKIAAIGYQFVQDKKFDSAKEQYDMAIMLNPANPYFYFFRGVSYFNLNVLDKAIDDWKSAFKLNVDEVKKAAAFNLSVAYDTLNKDSMALYYLEEAQKLGYQPAPGYADKLKTKKQGQKRR